MQSSGEEEEEEEGEDDNMFLNNRQTYILIPSCPGYPIWLRGDVIIMEKAARGYF